MAPIVDPQTILYAIVGGAVPAILWLWFWLKEEDTDKTESIGLIILTFITGALSVIVAIALEKFSLGYITNPTLQIITWAAIEEILKYSAVLILVLNSKAIEKPIDYPMYFIAAALGFAALENVLYLIHPIAVSGTVVGALTGNLRFLGSTLLHAIASSMIGIALGLAFYRGFLNRGFYLLLGLATAITLHSLFNLFIMNGGNVNFLQVYGFLWIVAIINILIFEKLKRMGDNVVA